MLRTYTAVVIGRFQSEDLTAGHKRILDYAIGHTSIRGISSHLILVGTRPTRYVHGNPLSYEIRRDMILKSYPKATVLPLSDQDDDIVWSQKLDDILGAFPNPVLFGGRDSFIPHYSGKYECVEIPEIPNVSATSLRSKLKDYNPAENNKSFRRGIIHAVENKFPSVFPTVDIGVIKHHPEHPQILLGRKPNNLFWCIMGGFVDPADDDFISAAYRELHEEVANLNTHELEYVGSFTINDWRYSNTPDAIITSLYLTYYLSGGPQGADDLAEVKWFSFDDARKHIGKHHSILLEKLINKHNNKNEKKSAY